MNSSMRRRLRHLYKELPQKDLIEAVRRVGLSNRIRIFMLGAFESLVHGSRLNARLIYQLETDFICILHHCEYPPDRKDERKLARRRTVLRKRITPCHFVKTCEGLIETIRGEANMRGGTFVAAKYELLKVAPPRDVALSASERSRIEFLEEVCSEILF